jgi:3'-phosphoadenosine 5'-phosphosulfate sulfotransferase (PAPS reductase)/FAD synthetase
MSRTICWFSCGAASAVATKLTLSEGISDVRIVYCETGSEHPDNERFLAECEEWFGHSILRIKNPLYEDTFDVWLKERYMAGHKGAPCTREMKFIPRLDYQLPSDTHVWGYTADKADVKRAGRMIAEYPAMEQRNPLIDRKLTKSNVLAMLQGAGIEIPTMYKLGFHNNNCIGCVKSSSPAYWALVRQHFPREFYRIAGLARELNARLIIVGRKWDPEKGKMVNIRAFIDEIPRDQSTKNPLAPSCDFLCQFAEQEMAA